jgi:hypothetical protein
VERAKHATAASPTTASPRQHGLWAEGVSFGGVGRRGSQSAAYKKNGGEVGMERRASRTGGTVRAKFLGVATARFLGKRGDGGRQSGEQG